MIEAIGDLTAPGTRLELTCVHLWSAAGLSEEIMASFSEVGGLGI